MFYDFLKRVDFYIHNIQNFGLNKINRIKSCPDLKTIDFDEKNEMEVSFNISSDAILTKRLNKHHNDISVCTRSLSNRISPNCFDAILKQILYAIFDLKKPVIIPTLDGNIRLQAENNQTFNIRYFDDLCHNEYQK